MENYSTAMNFFLKFTFFDFITFRKKSRMLQSPPPHENLVPEIKGFLGFSQDKDHWHCWFHRSCTSIVDFLLVFIFVFVTLRDFSIGYLVHPLSSEGVLDAPTLRKTAIFESSFVDSGVRLSSFVAVEFRISDI